MKRYLVSRYTSGRHKKPLTKHEFSTLDGAIECSMMCVRLGEAALLQALDKEHERLIHTPEQRRKVQWVEAL